jgi:hypothetical protein
MDINLILNMDNASSPSIELRSSPPPSLAPYPAPRQKRTRSAYHQDDSTPSDGPLFSSDPPDPSVDEYFQPRRKRQYRGTWWGEVMQNGTEEPVQQRTKAAFSRNMDSGVWMGSDATEEGFGSDDTVPDDTVLDDTAPLNQQPQLSATRRLPLPLSFSPPEPTSEQKASAIIYDCLDQSNEVIDLE